MASLLDPLSMDRLDQHRSAGWWRHESPVREVWALPGPGGQPAPSARA